MHRQVSCAPASLIGASCVSDSWLSVSGIKGTDQKRSGALSLPVHVSLFGCV